MNRRYVAPLLLAALVVLAGCGGGGGGTGGGDTATTTEAPTTEAPTTTPEPTVETVAYPDGLSAEGYANDTAAMATFRTALASGPSYTTRMNVEAGGVTQTLLARTNPSAQRSYAETQRNGSVTYELYYANGTQSLRDASGSETRYGSTNATFDGVIMGYNGGQFLQQLTLLDLEAASVERVDGRTIITYDVTGPRSSETGAESASGRVQVTTEGQLVAFEYTVVSQQGQELSVDWVQSNVGSTTVSEPDWLSNAR